MTVVALLAGLLPTSVHVVESFGDLDAPLFEEEQPFVVAAVPARRAEFATGRACARQAMARLGIPPAPLLSGAHREPLWPVGVVGSVTHCAGYRAAAVTRATETAVLGIDAEPDEPLPLDVAPVVLTPAERCALNELPSGCGAPSWDRILFCAKEATYKAWWPLMRGWLGFEDVRVSLAEDGTFRVRLLRPQPHLTLGPVLGFEGRWGRAGGLVGAAVIRRSHSSRLPANGSR